MSKFNPNKFLEYIIEETDIDEKGKELCKTLQSSMYFVAPELLGSFFFNGYKSKVGICSILRKYAADDNEMCNEIKRRYVELCEEYKQSQQERDLYDE